MYPFAGALRYVDTAKPGQTGEPFVHHRWIDTYTAAVTRQLRLEDNLATRTDPGQWADRAAYYWAVMVHAHPYREGNGRSQRAFVELLARHAGQEIVWPDDMEQVNIAASVASLHGDNRGLVDLLSRSVVPATAVAQSTPNAAQIAARSLPRSLGKVRPASSKPGSPADPPPQRRPPPGLSL